MHLMEEVVVVVAVVEVVEGAMNQRQPENRLADIQQKMIKSSTFRNIYIVDSIWHNADLIDRFGQYMALSKRYTFKK